MFGFACDETPELMPLAISLAHKAVQKAERRAQEPRVCPICGRTERRRLLWSTKTDVPVRVDTVVLSTQHSPECHVGTDSRRRRVEHVIQAGDPGQAGWMRTPKFYVNPTGRFVVGGPVGDTGLDRAVRLLWIPMAGMAVTGAAPSPERTRPKWTVPGLMRHAMWRRTL